MWNVLEVGLQIWTNPMEQKGMTFAHDLYVVVGKQSRTENAYAGHQHNIFI